MSAGSTAVPPSRRRLAALRLAAQGIAGRGLSSPVEVVRRLLAMQGQDFPGARWSIGLRRPGSTEAEVSAAFDGGEIVRSWPMRGTLHVVAAEDLGWMLELTSARSIASAGRRRAVLGITEQDVGCSRAAAVAALEGGRALSRPELQAAISAAGVSTAGQRGYHLLWYLAQTGTLVLGPMHRGQQCFALLDEWVRTPRSLDRDEALGELTSRYYGGHGPATVADLARWSGLTVADVRRGLAVSGGRLARLEVDGIEHHLSPEALEAPQGDARAHADGMAVDAHLLPGFDEYILGYRDRSFAIAPEHSQAVVPGGNGMFAATIVVDGEVVGTWRRSLAARSTDIELAPFAGALSADARRGLEAAAEAFGRFVGRPARLREREQSQSAGPLPASSGATRDAVAAVPAHAKRSPRTG